jgi:hypothetical protein
LELVVFQWRQQDCRVLQEFSQVFKAATKNEH